ncbi:MAG: hypothetical protein E6J67_23535 [Deltaproteobacteria bacterium]|nr:MAG: hypothetical protein E6J67_23535 [Deltaproteobacteria bacterium]
MVFIVRLSCSGCLLKRDVPLQKEVDEVVADVGRLALLAVAVENLNDGLRKAEPRTSARASAAFPEGSGC